MVDHSNSGDAPRGSELVLGKPQAFWAARRTFIVIGAMVGALNGVMGAALLIWAAPVSHWIRDSWLLVGAGYAAVMAFWWILMSWFLWWINFRMRGSGEEGI